MKRWVYTKKELIELAKKYNYGGYLRIHILVYKDTDQPIVVKTVEDLINALDCIDDTTILELIDYNYKNYGYTMYKII